MISDDRQAFFEQKLAENTLRTAYYEAVADSERKKGRMFKAKEWDDRVRQLKKEREEIMAKIDELYPVKGKHGGTV